MQLRPFGPTKREVAVIGQGTWYQKGDDRARRLPRCAEASISA